MKKINIEKIFVILGLIFGCLFIYVIPPFQSPDEDSHFKKAYVISKGEFYQKQENDIIGLEIPNQMSNYIGNKLQMMGNRESKYTYSDFYYDQLLPGDFKETSLTPVSTAATTPVAHLIPGIGILISKILSPIFVNGTPSTVYMLQFARFFSLISYLTIGYFAIKMTPIFKKSMCAILLLPMSLFLGSMVTYDNLLLVTSLLAVSLILKLIYDTKFVFDKKVFFAFCAIGYILLNIKTIYFPVLALLLLVPVNKFKNKSKKDKIKTYIALFATILIITLILKIPNFLLESTSASSTSEQLMFIIKHPFTYFMIFVKNFIGQFYIQMYWMVGTFGLLDTYLPPLVVLVAFINLFIVFLTDAISEKIKAELKMKIIMLLFLVLGVGGMYTAMYISWTPSVLGVIGGNEITGVQGRYFIPLLISFPILFSTKIFNKNKKIFDLSKEYFNKSILVTSIVLIISIITCLTRFWI